MFTRSSVASSDPTMAVGIIDGENEIAGSFNGTFSGDGLDAVSGRFTARALSGTVLVADEEGREIARAPEIRLTVRGDSTVTLFRVVIGNRFHWERAEDQTFQGNLVLKLRENGTIVAISEIGLEDYLKSVISSEMNAAAPVEFLKAHSILSRSWLLAALKRKGDAKERAADAAKAIERDGEIVRWYEQEDHDLYDVCADDHCQRYQGITKIISAHVGQVIGETRGKVLVYGDEICDARYSKACGGLTEKFSTSWEGREVPYLTSVADSVVPHYSIRTEEEATRWILTEPEAYCNTKDKTILEKILPHFDRETENFFRWKVVYGREELEEILREKSGFDFGTLKEILPLQRGPSGRIYRLQIIGSGKSMIVGKELEIRRWLSRTHLYSSAFTVMAERNPSGEASSFIFRGAGWGHGVGLCQIGAAVMAAQGFKAEEILCHYFPGTEIARFY
jgi:stage II sporulation protein D